MEPSAQKFENQMRLKVLSYVLGQRLHAPATHALADDVQDAVGEKTGRIAAFNDARKLLRQMLPRAHFEGPALNEEAMWEDAAALLSLHFSVAP
jgi:hypothetical protein